MKTLTTMAVVAVSLSLMSAAQGTEDDPVVLEAIAIIEQTGEDDEALQSSNTYDSFEPVDSGLTVISADAVANGSQGNIDTSELLNALPSVQLDVDRYNGSDRAEQHLNPSDFTISGGRFYDNNLMVDGVSVTSDLDVTQAQDNQNYNEVGGQSAQTFYLHPDALESIDVLDSNVSASVGEFRGGAVNYQIRAPRDTFHMQYRAGLQTDDMVNYIGEDDDGDPYPDFLKYQTSLLVDAPVNERLKTMWLYSRSESLSTYTRDEAYGGDDYTNGDLSQNFLLKAVYQLNDDLNIEGSVSYSPYKSEYLASNAVNAERVSHSSGLLSYLQLSGYHGETDWTAKVSYNLSDASRDWAGDRYRWSSDSAYGSTLCSDSYCFVGGYGDINQTQQDYRFATDASRDLAGGTISAGAQLTYTEALKERPNTNTYYQTSEVDSDGNIQCSADDDACTSDTVFTRKIVYTAYKANVSVYKQALWSEYERDFGSLTVRSGLRYSYDDYLSNHNLAPRLTASWEFRPDYYLTLGANRYYRSNMLVYALKEATPVTVTYERELNDDGTVTDWTYASEGTVYNYSVGNLKTPYSDELTAALTLPTALSGHFRIKGKTRLYRDGFSTSREYDSNDEQNVTLGNDDEYDYDEIILEWSGKYGRHALTANLTWSQTRNDNGATSYLSELDIEEMDNNDVYYHGEIVTELALNNYENAQNYASPLTANLAWSTTWLQQRLATQLALKMRGQYYYIEDTGDSIEIDGISYDVYDKVKVDAYPEVSLNSRLQAFKTANTKTLLEARVTNLFNDNPNSASSTYQRGRAIWLGATVDFM